MHVILSRLSVRLPLDTHYQGAARDISRKAVCESWLLLVTMLMAVVD